MWTRAAPIVITALAALLFLLALPIDWGRLFREPGSLEVTGPLDVVVTGGDHWIMEDGVTPWYPMYGNEWAARDSLGHIMATSATCDINGETLKLEWDPLSGFGEPAGAWLLPEGEHAAHCAVRLVTGETAQTSHTVTFDPGAPPNQLPLVLRSPADATVEGASSVALYTMGRDEWVVVDDRDEAQVDCTIGGVRRQVGEAQAWWYLHEGTHTARCYVRDQVGATVLEHTVTAVIGEPPPAAADPGAGLFASPADEARVKGISAMFSAGEIEAAEYARALAYLQASGIVNFDISGDPSWDGPAVGIGSDPAIHAGWNGHAGGGVSNEEYRRHLERVAASGYFEGLGG